MIRCEESLFEPLSCIKQTRREYFPCSQALVKRVLLTWNRLQRTSPRVRSSEVCEPWWFVFKGFRYKTQFAGPVSPPCLRRYLFATLSEERSRTDEIQIHITL
jgi:hypothetical protein